MNEDEAPTTAADIRAMAEQAEAEAAEAEALAAAARARARAIQLRRQAESAEAAEEQTRADKPAESEQEDTQASAEAESSQAEEDADEVDVVSDAAAEASARQRTWYRRWSRRLRTSTIAAILAVIVILAALAGSVYMVLEHRDASEQRQRAAEFEAAARQGIVNLTSLDFNNAKRDVQRVLDDSTGTFKDDFQKTADDFVKVVEQSQVVEKGTVKAAAVDLNSMTKDSAVVLVASTSEVTNAAGAKQDPRNFRLIVTVTRDGDQIKMSKVEFVP